MTNFRKLCDELLDELQYQTDWRIAEELKARASAALAELEPEGPTDEDLWDIGERHLWTGTDESTIAYDRILTSFIEAAHVVLARWGNHPGSPDSSTQPS